MNQITPMIDNSGAEYDIPNNELEEFNADMGTGVQRQYLYRTEDGSNYAIPESESKDFLADFPNAQPVRRVQFHDGTTEDVPANEMRSFFNRYRTEDKYKADRDATRARIESETPEAPSPVWEGTKAFFSGLGRAFVNPVEAWKENVGEDNIGTQMVTSANDAANALAAGVIKIPYKLEQVLGYAAGGRNTAVGNWLINDAQASQGVIDKYLPQNEKAQFGDEDAVEIANKIQGISSTLFNFTLSGAVAGSAGAPTIVAMDSTDAYIDTYDRAVARGAKPEEANAIATEAFMWNAVMEGTLINGGIKPLHKAANKLAAGPMLDLTRKTFSGITRGLTVGTLRNYVARVTGHIASTAAIMGVDMAGKESIRQSAEGEGQDFGQIAEAGKEGLVEGGIMGLMFGTVSGLTAAGEFRAYHKAMKKSFGDMVMKNIDTPQGREAMARMNPEGTYDFLKAREGGGVPSRGQADRMILPDNLSGRQRAEIADKFLKDGITPEKIRADIEARVPRAETAEPGAEAPKAALTPPNEVVPPAKTPPETPVQPVEPPKASESTAGSTVVKPETAEVSKTTPEAQTSSEAVFERSTAVAVQQNSGNPPVTTGEKPVEAPVEPPIVAGNGAKTPETAPETPAETPVPEVAAPEAGTNVAEKPPLVPEKPAETPVSGQEVAEKGETSPVEPPTTEPVAPTETQADSGKKATTKDKHLKPEESKPDPVADAGMLVRKAQSNLYDVNFSPAGKKQKAAAQKRFDDAVETFKQTIADKTVPIERLKQMLEMHEKYEAEYTPADISRSQHHNWEISNALRTEIANREGRTPPPKRNAYHPQGIPPEDPWMGAVRKDPEAIALNEKYKAAKTPEEKDALRKKFDVILAKHKAEWEAGNSGSAPKTDPQTAAPETPAPTTVRENTGRTLGEQKNAVVSALDEAYAAAEAREAKYKEKQMNAETKSHEERLVKYKEKLNYLEATHAAKRGRLSGDERAKADEKYNKNKAELEREIMTTQNTINEIRAKFAAPAPERLTVDMGGGARFRVTGSTEELKGIRAQMKKMPATVRIEKKPTIEKIEKAMSSILPDLKDDSVSRSRPIGKIRHEDGLMVATDGRMLFFHENKAIKDDGNSDYPNWRQVVPKSPMEKSKPIPLEEFYPKVAKASAYAARLENMEMMPEMVLMPDGKTVEFIIQDGREVLFSTAKDLKGATRIAKVNPDFVMKTIRAAAAAGENALTIRWDDNSKPLMFTGESCTSVVMPIRSAGRTTDYMKPIEKIEGLEELYGKAAPTPAAKPAEKQAAQIVETPSTSATRKRIEQSVNKDLALEGWDKDAKARIRSSVKAVTEKLTEAQALEVADALEAEWKASVEATNADKAFRRDKSWDHEKWVRETGSALKKARENTKKVLDRHNVFVEHNGDWVLYNDKGEVVATTPQTAAKKPETKSAEPGKKELTHDEKVDLATELIANQVRKDPSFKDTPNSRYRSGAEQLVNMIETKNADGLRERFNGMNKGSVKAFEAITGIKMPSTQKGQHEVVDRFCGISPEERVKIDAERKAAREAAAEAERRAEALAEGEKIMKETRIRLHDGRVVTAQQLLEEGWNIKKVKRGATTNLHLIDPKKSGYVKVKGRAFEYADDFIAKRDAAKAREDFDHDSIVLSGDEVRKSMPGYNRLDWRTHVDKTGFVAPRMERHFQHLLKTRKGKGNGSVAFLAGGNGSGKSTATKNLIQNFDFIVDSTLGNLDVARKQIKAILDNGQKPSIFYVYRNPVDALNGVIERAEGGGHMVSPLSFANSHVKARENVGLLAKEFGDKINVTIIDNSKSDKPFISLEELEKKEKIEHEQLRKQAADRIAEVEARAGLGGRRTGEAGAVKGGSEKAGGEVTAEKSFLPGGVIEARPALESGNPPPPEGWRILGANGGKSFAVKVPDKKTFGEWVEKNISKIVGDYSLDDGGVLLKNGDTHSVNSILLHMAGAETGAITPIRSRYLTDKQIEAKLGKSPDVLSPEWDAYYDKAKLMRLENAARYDLGNDADVKAELGGKDEDGDPTHEKFYVNGERTSVYSMGENRFFIDYLHYNIDDPRIDKLATDFMAGRKGADHKWNIDESGPEFMNFKDALDFSNLPEVKAIVAEFKAACDAELAREAAASGSVTPQTKLDVYREYAKNAVSAENATMDRVRDAMYRASSPFEEKTDADIFFNRLQTMLNEAFRADKQAQALDAQYKKAKTDAERIALQSKFHEHGIAFADNFLKTHKDAILKEFDKVELKPGESVAEADNRVSGNEQTSVADEATSYAAEVDAAIAAEEAGGETGAPANAPSPSLFTTVNSPRGRGTGTLSQGDPKSLGTGTKGRKIVTPQTFLRRAQELFPNVAIRRKGTARMAKWAAGHFEPTYRLIRSRDMNSIRTVAHELGHDIEYLTRYDVPRLPAVKRDLSDLGHHLYGPDGPKPPSYIGEGFAEYVRGYICNAPNLHEVAPDLDTWFRGDFKKKHPQIVKNLDELRDMVQTMKEQSASQIVGGFMRPSTEAVSRAWKKTLDFFSGENWNDRGSIILHGMKKSGIDKLFHWQDDFRALEAEKDPAKRAELAKSISDKIEKHPYIFATITRGTASQRVMDMARHGTTNLLGNKKTGESLKEIFADFSPKEREAWKKYAIAKHGIVNYFEKGLDFGLPADVLQAVVTEYESPKFRDALRRYTDYSHRILHLGVESGLISQETYDKIVDNHPIYVRITRRYSQDGAGARQGGQAINRRTGGFDHIFDPIDAALMDQEKFLRACFQARTLQLIVGAGRRGAAANINSARLNGGPNTTNVNPVDEAHIAVGAYWPVEVPNAQEAVKFSAAKLQKQLTELAGNFAERMSLTEDDSIPIQDFIEDLTTTPDAHGLIAQMTIFRDKPSYGKHNLVSVYTDGQLRTFELPDMKWANMLTDVYDKSEFSPVEKLFGLATAGIRLGATTVNPGFAIRNGIRDSLHSAVMSETGAMPGVSTLHGMLQQILGSEAAELFRAMGGHMSDLVGVTKEQKWNHGGKVALAQNPLQTVGAYSPLDWVLMKPVIKTCADILSNPELGPRIREMSAVLAKCREAGLSDNAAAILAMSHAKDISIDFQRAGRLMKHINHFIPFSNAMWRGTEQTVRNLGLLPALPHQFEDRAGRRGARTVGRGLGYITSWVTALALLEMAGHDEDGRRRAFERTKDEKWNYAHFDDWRIPLPFELGHIFGAIPKAAVYEMYGDEGALKECIQEFGHTLPTKYANPDTAVGSISLFTPWIGLLRNEDYRGRPIVPEHIMENREKKDWYTQYTTELSKKIGATVGWSPAQLEYMLDSYTGGLYRRMALMAENIDDTSRLAEGRGVSMLDTLRARPQANRLIEDFYKFGEEGKQKLGSGTITLEEYGKLASQNAVKKRLTEKFDEMRAARADKSMPLAEQDRVVNEAAAEANEIVRAFNARDDYRQRGIAYAAAQLTGKEITEIDQKDKEKFLGLLKGVPKNDVVTALIAFGGELIPVRSKGVETYHQRWSSQNINQRVGRILMMMQD